MPTQVNVHEAKTHFSKLIDRAHAGEEIIVAKAGKPFVRLVAIEPEQKIQRKPGAGKSIIPDLPDSFFFDSLPDEELRAWGML